MDCRARTLGAATALLVTLMVAGVTLPVPFVAVGRGPTFDTLGAVDGKPVVTITDLPTHPTSGQLNMTTVGVASGLTAADVLRLWIADDRQVVPRTAVARPGETEDQAAQRNATLFADSQTAAKAAALSHVGLPTIPVVERLTLDSPAAGLLEPGDELEAIDGVALSGAQSLQAALLDRRAGESAALTVRRGTEPPRDVEVVVGARPGSDGGYLGVFLTARPTRDDQVTISLGDVGGPSAGLIFALAVVDRLTPGELTGGRFVAGTGTIVATGEVGEIQGIPFKMLAAREAGATVFLAPAANCDEARTTVPDGLQLVRVETLAGAVAALDTLRAGGTPPTC
ncbi:MAG: YlbL family protein [Pseudonocardia sp.]